MLGTSVPSAVLAEDFSQQPDMQWDSEAVDETADPEEQDQTEEVTGGISVSDNNSENSSEDMGTGAGDDFTSDVTEEPDAEEPGLEEPEDKTEESGESSEEQDQNGAADGAEEISEETEELASPEAEEPDQLEEEKLSDDQLDGAEELVSAGESSATGIVASGNCGPTHDIGGTGVAINKDGSNITDTAKWTLDSQGTLTISGSGETTSYPIIIAESGQKFFTFSHYGKYRCTDQKHQQKPHKQPYILLITLIRQNMQKCCSKYMKKSQAFHPLIKFCSHLKPPPAIRIRNVSIHKISAVNRILIRSAHPSAMVPKASTSRLSDTGCAAAAKKR